MYKIKKIHKIIFKVSSGIVFFLSIADTYFLLKYEHFSQLFWFCNAALFLLAFGLFFESSIVITGIFIGAIVVQIPWILDFLVQLFFGYSLIGVASYMFDYGFNNIRFYIELDHLLIIPLSIYGIKKLGFNKNGWIFAVIVAIIINVGAYTFSSYENNVNCVFYSCFSDKVTIKENPFVYMIIWTFLIVVLIFIVNKIIYKILNRSSHKN